MDGDAANSVPGASWHSSFYGSPGYVGLSVVSYGPAAGMFSSFVAVLDIVLVFLIFKGDVRLT